MVKWKLITALVLGVVGLYTMFFGGPGLIQAVVGAIGLGAGLFLVIHTASPGLRNP